jgi:hypothetical protein
LTGQHPAKGAYLFVVILRAIAVSGKAGSMLRRRNPPFFAVALPVSPRIHLRQCGVSASGRRDKCLNECLLSLCRAE